jgi:hypothetical protein
MNTTTLESSAFAAWPGKRERQVRLIIPLICLGAILLGPRYTEADKSPPTPKIIITDSPDFPDMTFVLYRLKMFNPWDTGSQVDPAGAIVVPLNTEFDCAAVGERLAVLAVPRAVAEKAKGRADPAWLEPSAAGVVRVGGVLTISYQYSRPVPRYRLDKTDKGAKFTLLNPPAKILITNSPDFPDMTFVLYGLKMFNPWGTGIQVDPATAKIVPVDTEVRFGTRGEKFAVLAVPRAVAEKMKGRADPAWLEPSASGVVRVGELVTVPNVYPDRVFRYRLDKIDDYESTPGDGGLHFRLLNPPAARKHRRARVNRSSPLVAGGVLHVICGILVGGLSAFLIMALCRKAHRLESRQ